MICEFELLHIDSDIRFIRCLRCGVERTSRTERYTRECKGTAEVLYPKFGPGTYLENIIRDDFQVTQTNGCGCKSLRDNMNLWGPQGCRDRFPLIVKALKQNKQGVGLAQLLKAAIASLRPHTFKLNRFNPIPSIVTEAIRRAEVSHD